MVHSSKFGSEGERGVQTFKGDNYISEEDDAARKEMRR